MTQATMCAHPQSDHSLPHCKCVLRYCDDCPCINLPDKETYTHNSDTTPSIRFHIYQIIECCTAHGRIPLKDKKCATYVNKNLHQTNLQKYTPEKR